MGSSFKDGMAVGGGLCLWGIVDGETGLGCGCGKVEILV